MTTTTTPLTVLLDRVPALAAQFSSRAREGEQLATLPADLVAEAKTAGVFTMALPATLAEVVEDSAAPTPPEDHGVVLRRGNGDREAGERRR